MRETRVRAENWVAALRAARQRWGEPPHVPPGASCTVAPDGVVTVMDAMSRRRFVLTEAAASTPAPPLAQTVGFEPDTLAKPGAGSSRQSVPGGKRRRKLAQTVAMVPVASGNPRPPSPIAVGKSRPLNQTVSFEREPPRPSRPATGGRDAALDAIAARQRRRQRFNTVALDRTELAKRGAQQPAQPVGRPTSAANHPSPPPPAGPNPAPATASPTAASSLAVPTSLPQQAVTPAPTTPRAIQSRLPPPASVPIASEAAASTWTAVTPTGTASPVARGNHPGQPTPGGPITLLFSRDEDPSDSNPLTYRERAFLVEPAATIAHAEVTLRRELAALQDSLRHAPTGKFCSLAVFDHHWEGEPLAPPLIVLEWKDWKGAADIDYPAAALARRPSAAPEGDDGRLEVAFDGLQGLSGIATAGAAMELAIAVTDEVVPAQAISACLYDSETDQLRFVAASGPGAAKRRGTAIPSHRGLLGLAFAHTETTTVIGNVGVEPVFDASIDARPEVEAHNMLLRPLALYRQPLGMLQLINRSDGNGFSESDVNVINYIADRVAETIAELRSRSLA